MKTTFTEYVYELKDDFKDRIGKVRISKGTIVYSDEQSLDVCDPGEVCVRRYRFGVEGPNRNGNYYGVPLAILEEVNSHKVDCQSITGDSDDQ